MWNFTDDKSLYNEDLLQDVPKLIQESSPTDHEEIPMSLILLSTWFPLMGRGGHTETLRLLTTPSST